MMANELKPCPFCGESEAELKHFDVMESLEIGEFCGIRCNHCGMNFFQDGTKEQMVRDWNTRNYKWGAK